MITKFTVRNFMGIEKEITLNCLANNKIKRKNSPFMSDDEGVNILKSIGIIGSNGSGKTSILNALMTIQTFINYPFRKSNATNKNFIEQIKKLPKEILEEIITDFNTLKLPSANINYSNEDTYICIETYIPDNSFEAAGYYKYSLTYDCGYENSGIKEEKLEYRKKYNSKKETCIFCVKNIIESELGTKILYENNTLNFDKSMLNYYKTFEKEINNMDFIFNGDSFDIKEFYDSHIDVFCELSNLADDKITNVEVEKKDNEERLIFLNKNNKKLYFEQLSEGTRKILVLGCKIINSIEKNTIIVIDEIEKSLHPSLSKLLVSLIQNNKRKTYNQLIFTTHSLYLALGLDHDQLYYIDNKNDDYIFQSISDAKRNNVITKDKTIPMAMIENLLINNPSEIKINKFIDSFN